MAKVFAVGEDDLEKVEAGVEASAEFLWVEGPFAVGDQNPSLAYQLCQGDLGRLLAEDGAAGIAWKLLDGQLRPTALLKKVKASLRLPS